MEKTSMLSVGIDLGTSTTQLVVSRLTVLHGPGSVPVLSLRNILLKHVFL